LYKVISWFPKFAFAFNVYRYVETIDTRGKSHITLGRTPNNDVVLEHPSSSRLHAVLQFQDGGAEAFLYDAVGLYNFNPVYS
jgi:hypothetical protein